VLQRLLEKGWVRGLLYSWFFSAALALFLWATFPMDALRDRIVEEARAKAGLDLEIGRVGFAGLTGLQLREVTILLDPSLAPPPPPAAEGEEPPAPAAPKVVLDRVSAKLELLTLARGGRGVSFSLEAFGGELQGRFEQGKDRQQLSAKGGGFLLARSPLQLFAGVDLEGVLGTVELELASEGKDFSKAEGKLVLKGESFTLHGGTVQGFELPKIVLGALDVRVPIDGGKATIEALSLNGADMEVAIDGGLVRLAPKLSQSTLAGKLKIKPSDEWWNRNEMLKNMANFALPAGKDGFRTITLSGQLQKPSFRPQK